MSSCVTALRAAMPPETVGTVGQSRAERRGQSLGPLPVLAATFGASYAATTIVR
ncbi:MAG: hypothetical protein JWO11_2661 [Nocardioides sp.]|nr:hypothetical protein [Nocardioides sp.]